MRSLTANYLESHREYFEPFCQTPYEELIRNVLTMGKEADGLGVGPLQVILRVKIDIVTIDRNYAEALQFDQMKIAGKCPLIYLLYRHGNYDIIYSKYQSNADGFDVQSEQFQARIRLPHNYDVQNPGVPFFIELEQNGQESPLEEFKPFKIQYIFPYVSTAETAKNQQATKEQQQIDEVKIQKCGVCQSEIEEQNIVELTCHHKICKYCLEDWIIQKTGGKIVIKNAEQRKRVTCYHCNHILTDEEIEKAVGKEKFENAQKNSLEAK